MRKPDFTFRPISLIYGAEDRENLGPLIKLKCEQQKVKRNLIILIIFFIPIILQDLKEHPVILGNGCMVDIKIMTQGDGKVKQTFCASRLSKAKQCDHQGKMQYPPSVDFYKYPPNTDMLEQIAP